MRCQGILFVLITPVKENKLSLEVIFASKLTVFREIWIRSRWKVAKNWILAQNKSKIPRKMKL